MIVVVFLCQLTNPIR